MVISYNAVLRFPNTETESRYKEVLDVEKDCYNYLSQIFDRIDFKHHRLSRYDVQSKYYKELREKFPLLSSQMVLKAILEAVGNWTTCIANEKDNFEPPIKTNWSMVLDKRLYNKLTSSSVDLTVPGFKRIRCTFDSYKEVKRTKHNNRFGQIPLKEIQTTLEYKAPLLGKEVVTVEPAYTSRLDYRGLPEGKRLGTRYFASDGEMLDADGNGACNIVLRHRPDSIVVKPTYGSMVFSGRPMSTGQSWLQLVQTVATTSTPPLVSV